MSNSPGFKDHFSGHADDYARYRPDYPGELYAWLAECAPGTGLAWDAGTGNGQAARGLARHFNRVHASDASREQIANAPSSERIGYAVEPAEQCSLGDAVADLVSVSQALHWFDHHRFFNEVRRVLRPGGLFAAWTYRGAVVSERVDQVVRHYHDAIVGAYWPPERRMVEEGYSGIGIPFREIDPPAMAISVEWRLDDYCRYLRTWSATQRFMKANGTDPLQRVLPELIKAWGGLDRLRTIRWPMVIRAGLN